MIDILLPWVDPSDPLWIADYKEYDIWENMEQARFRDFGLLQKQIEHIQRFMPWGRLRLILARESQKPKWLPKDVDIVYHEEFIPDEFLPTFNSNTIEIFLLRIPDLSDKFIYTNDDMFPLVPLEESDFFCDDKVITKWRTMDTPKSEFQKSCKLNYDKAREGLGMGVDWYGEFFKPQHSFSPLIKSRLHQPKVIPRPTKFRDLPTNIHQSYYTDCLILSGYAMDGGPEFRYTDFHDDVETLERKFREAEVVCINDNGEYSQIYMDKVRELLRI